MPECLLYRDISVTLGNNIGERANTTKMLND